MNFIKFCLLSIITVLLAACNNETSPDYLMRHPDVLQREVKQCAETDQNAAHCQMVQNTRQEFVSLVEAMQADPEGFGADILHAEMKTAHYQQAVLEAQTAVQNSANSASRLRYEAQLKTAQENLAQNLLDIKQRLAIISLASPG